MDPFGEKGREGWDGSVGRLDMWRLAAAAAAVAAGGTTRLVALKGGTVETRDVDPRSGRWYVVGQEERGGDREDRC